MKQNCIRLIYLTGLLVCMVFEISALSITRYVRSGATGNGTSWHDVQIDRSYYLDGNKRDPNVWHIGALGVIPSDNTSTETEKVTASTDNQIETFDEFLKRFTSDVDFQWSRIKFPLGTLDLGGAESLPYTKDCWVLRIGVEAFKVGHTEENDGEFVWDAKFVSQGDDKVIYTDEYSGIYYSKDTFTFERIGGQWYVTAHEIVFPTMLTIDEFKQNVKEANKKYVK